MDDRLSHFSVARGQILGFSIGFRSRPYNTLARYECVIVRLFKTEKRVDGAYCEWSAGDAVAGCVVHVTSERVTVERVQRKSARTADETETPGHKPSTCTETAANSAAQNDIHRHTSQQVSCAIIKYN